MIMIIFNEFFSYESESKKHYLCYMIPYGGTIWPKTLKDVAAGTPCHCTGSALCTRANRDGNKKFLNVFAEHLYLHSKP